MLKNIESENRWKRRIPMNYNYSIEFRNNCTKVLKRQKLDTHQASNGGLHHSVYFDTVLLAGPRCGLRSTLAGQNERSSGGARSLLQNHLAKLPRDKQEACSVDKDLRRRSHRMVPSFELRSSSQRRDSRRKTHCSKQTGANATSLVPRVVHTNEYESEQN
jgi:hypothetical protein